MSQEEWKSISADSAPPGVYSVNASKEDQEKWWASLKGTRKPLLYVEMKRTLAYGTRLVVKVYETGDVVFSANGTVRMDAQEWIDFTRAVNEAAETIWHHKHGGKENV